MAYSNNINNRRATIGAEDGPQNLATPSRDVEIIETTNDSLVIEDLTSKTISTSFGRPEDYVELHIYNTADQLLHSETNFTDFIKSYNGEKITAIKIDAEQVLADRNYTSGQYTLKIHILRNKIFNTAYLPFKINDLSVSRREIKSTIVEVDNELFDIEVENFILEIEGASYFKEFLLNFGQGLFATGINLILNTDPLKHELILKTSEPLSDEIQKGHNFKVVEELADPYDIYVDLGGSQIDEGTIELQGPNFQINTRQNNSIPSDLKTYNELLEYSVSSSYNRLLNKLENPDTLNLQYDFIRTVSSSMEELDRPYHFENFVHFSSAVDRLKNFRYKLKKIEDFEAQLVSASLITSSNNSLRFTEYKTRLKNKKRDIIKGFDGYEQFLYNTTGSNPYTWPKDNPIAPYNLYSITSSEAKDWLGDVNSAIPHSHYTGQLHSASFYDNQNEYRLSRLIPEHITSNPNNSFYLSFVNMVGQQFDHIWAHIKHLTEINNLDNKFGISKELVYFQLKSLGIDTFDQFENTNLFEYILGESIYGNSVGDLQIGKYIVGGPDKVFYNVPQGTKTYVTASNEGSTPKGDITREIWKRLYNNVPYLLKTKGTERGINALMNCYGIPRTILNVKEYGGNTLLSGPLKDLETAGTYKTFSYEKSGLNLKGESGTGGYFIKTKWSSSKTDALSASQKTVEFRINPKKILDGNNDPLNQHLFTLSGSDASKDPHLILTPYTGTDISQSNDANRYGRLELIRNGTSQAQTNYFQVFDGNFWNIHIGTDAENNRLYFGAHQSNYLKRVFEYTSSIGLIPADRQLTFGDPTHGGNNIGGALNAYFGGVPANNSSAYDSIDGLRFSGSMQEIKYHFGELLTHHTLKKHALEPFMYSGNTPSSSYDNVVLRLPLGSNDKEESGSFQPKIDVNFLEYGGVSGVTAESSGGSQIGNGFIVGGGTRYVKSNISVFDKWEEVVETHHLPTPDTVGASMTSEKIRIEDSTIPSDNLLMVDKRRETSTLDSQPPDYEDLGIYFSPTTEINEDILYTLGSFRLDDYIGNPLPSAQSSSIYDDLKDIRNYYNKKVKDQYNYTEYIKLIQQYDHTLFKIIENFTPARSNLKTGLLIEPNFLERSKIKREIPIRSDGQTMITGSHQTFEIPISANYPDNKMYAFASSSQLTKVGFGCDKFPNSPGCASASIGEWEPGSYVVSYNNLTDVTSSKTSERLEQGLNTTIEIYDDYMDPIRRKYNRWGKLHGFNNQPCQDPIRPFVQRLSNLGTGVGAATVSPNKGVGFSSIGSGFKIEDYVPTSGVMGSFAIGEYTATPLAGGNFRGVGFSGIQCGFMIEGYLPKGQFGVGNAVIGSNFIVGTYTNIPTLNNNYRTHVSNTLLGNMTVGRKSKKYFQYQTYVKR